MAQKAKKRKAKQKKRMPPLSLLDRAIYLVLMLLAIILDFGILFLNFYLRKRVAFSVPNVLAASENSGLLWSLIPAIVLMLVAFIWSSYHYEERKPIFGKRGIKYGPPQYPSVYPVFMKNKPPVWVSENQKKSRKLGRNALLILIAVSLLPFPLSLSGRDSLQTDGSIVEYGVFNQEKEHYERDAVKEVEFSLIPDTRSGHYGTDWGWIIRLMLRLELPEYAVCVTIKTDEGDQFVFRSGDFRDWGEGEYTDWLEDMLYLKSLYPPERIVCADLHLLDYAASDDDLSQKERELLYTLFAVPAD